MRVAVIAATIAALAVVAFLVVDQFAPPEPGEPHSPDIARAPRLVAVLHGEQGELEILLRPFYLETERDQFNTKVWSDRLGTQGRYRYAMLWAVNHGSAPLPLPLVGEAKLLNEEIADWDAPDIASLLAQAPARLPAYFRHEVQIWSLPKREVAPGTMLRLAVAVPAGTSLKGLSPLRFGADGPLLSPGWVNGEDIKAYDLKPKGRLARLLRQELGEPPAESSPVRNGN